MPKDARDDEPPEHRREVVLRDGSKFQLDVKSALVIGGTLVAIAGSWFEQKARISTLDYELRAEIVRVANEGEKKQDSLEAKLEPIQDTICAIAKKQDVPASGCR
mgnify:FL=1